MLVMGFVLVAQIFAQAQTEFPKAEVFGGFSILSSGDNGNRDQFYGWQASAAGNLNKMAGIVADFAGNYRKESGVTVKVHQFLFGPQFTTRTEKASYFAHFLLGGVNARGGGFSENGFAMGIGGGVDVRASDRIAVRVVQFDWLPNRFEGEWSKSEVRFGFGVVFKVH